MISHEPLGPVVRNDDAQWFGVFDGAMQVFSDGGIKVVNPARAPAQLDMKEAIVSFAKGDWKQAFSLAEAETVFVVGLEAKHVYKIEIDDEEMYENASATPLAT